MGIGCQPCDDTLRNVDIVERYDKKISSWGPISRIEIPNSLGHVLVKS